MLPALVGGVDMAEQYLGGRAALAAEINAKTAARVRSYLESRDDWNLSRSLKNLVEQAIRDYDHRAVLELVQNAHDAQPPGARDGRILVRLDHDEGEFGTLVVANTGKPFTRSNFDALCDVAQSDKRADEGIGNKGIGFKSTLQLCRVPEVYSAGPQAEARAFDGYCFRFVEDGDLVALANGDEARAAEIAADVFHLCLPVALSAAPSSLETLAEDGYVTVVRLPLKSESARAEAKLELRALEDAPPTILFLRRISEIVVEELATGSTTRHEHRRIEKKLAELGPATVVNEVDLGDGGCFLVAEKLVDGDAFRAAIDASVAAERISEGWTDWQGEVRVGVAAPLDEDLASGRLYTFLPMGDQALAPFPGHVNAPFFANLARISFEDSVPLNDFLLDEVAVLSASLVLAAGAGTIELPPITIADLLSWRAPEHDRLLKAFEGEGADLSVAAVLPLRSPGQRWGDFRSTRAWDGEGRRVFTASSLVRSRTIQLLDEAISGDRLERLNAIVRLVVGGDLEPSDEEIAACGEAIAARAERRPFNKRWWEQFYDELADLVSDWQVLQGRRVLVDDDGRVQRCSNANAERPGPTPFFSPRAGSGKEAEDVDLRIPATLKRQIFFVNQQLNWTTKSGSSRVRTSGRRMLDDGDLVKDYHASELFSVMGRALRTKPTHARSRDSLKWIYDFVRSREEVPWSEIAGVQFRVPTADGDWIPADEALFSRQWDGLEDELLEELIARASAKSEQLQAMRARLLVPPESWPFPVDDRQYLREFLERLGVRSGLIPVRIARSILSADGRTFEELFAANSVPLPPATRDLWKRVLGACSPSGLRPYTNYRSREPQHRIPGQDDYEQFDEDSRRLYAQLIVMGLENWADSTLAIEVRRYNDATDRFTWPTPARAFLEHAQWLPMSRAGEREAWYFERPSEAWSDGMGDETTRPFAPLVPLPVRRLVESRPRSHSRLTDLGLRHWDSPATAGARLRLLSQLLEEGLVPDTVVASVRKANEDAWEELFQHAQADPFDSEQPPGVLVTRRGRLVVEFLDDKWESGEPIYVQDGEPTQALRLLEQRGASLLRFRRGTGTRVAELLSGHVGDRIRRISETRVTVTVDGAPFEPSDIGELLVTDERRWLIDLIAPLVELRSGQFRRLGPEAIRRTIDTLARVRIVFAQRLETRVDGTPVDAASRVLALGDRMHPTIVIRRSEVQNASTMLQSAAPAIAELLGYSDLADSIRLSIIDLDRGGWLDSGGPPLDAIAAVVGEPEHRIREITSGARQSVLELVRVMVPLLAVISPQNGAELWEAVDSLPDEASVKEWLDPRLVATSHTAERLIEACRRDDLNAARAVLGISLPELNAAVDRLGAPFERLRNAEGINHAFDYYLRVHRGDVIDSLRTAFAPTFHAKGSLEEYVARRDLDSLKPDPTWPDLYLDLDDQVIEGHVNRWLAEVDGPPVAAADSSWPRVDDLRRDNRSALHQLVETATVAVAAWEDAHGVPRSHAPGQADAVTDSASSAGWLDFEPLATEAAITWLAATGRWPAGMPLSLDPDDLGLSCDEIESAARGKAEVERRRQDQSRQITLDGSVLDASQENYGSIVASVAASVDPALLAVPARVANMAAVTAGPFRRGGVTRKGVTAARRPRLSEVQAAAVGLAGEVVAFAWLRVQYEDATDASWRSGYRNIVLGGDEGDDSLGYDFEVLTPRRRLLFEVKASVGDQCEFELTDAEIRAAQGLRRSDRYYVLFVTKVLTSDERALYLLPNPFSTEAVGLYRTMGSGLRLGFDLC